MSDGIKRGRITLIQRPGATATGMGCVCVGPAYGTPYCPCTLAWMAQQVDEDDLDDDDEYYED